MTAPGQHDGAPNQSVDGVRRTSPHIGRESACVMTRSGIRSWRARRAWMIRYSRRTRRDFTRTHEPRSGHNRQSPRSYGHPLPTLLAPLASMEAAHRLASEEPDG